MRAEGDQPSIAADVLSGENPELQLLVARGLFPLPPQQLLSLQVALARGSDAEVAEAAEQSLLQVDPKIAANAVAEETASEVIAYFASRPSHPVILEAILRKRAVASELLEVLAGTLPPDLQEILLLRQDAIVGHPEILERLEENPQLSPYASRRIAEYREHLLPRAAKEGPAEPTLPAEVQEAEDDDVVNAVLEARDLPAEGELDESTGLSEAQIRRLTIPVRVKLTRGASRTLRNILIKDKNPMVARAVLYGNALSDSEIELITNSRAVVEEVLEVIGQSRQWTRKYSIVHALVRNPRTPIGLAVRLASRLAVRDLRLLQRDHNVAQAVRSTAARLCRIKRN